MVGPGVGETGVVGVAEGVGVAVDRVGVADGTGVFVGTIVSDNEGDGNATAVGGGAFRSDDPGLQPTAATRASVRIAIRNVTRRSDVVSSNTPIYASS